MKRMLCAVAALVSAVRHTRDGAGTAGVDRRHRPRQLRRRAAGRHGRSAQPVARRRRRRTVTDSHGCYRFPALPPGPLRNDGDPAGLSAGEVVRRAPRARAGAEDRPRRWQVGGVTETVKVTGESPLIDVKQNAAGANVQAEIIERIPKGARLHRRSSRPRPGITNESRNRGIQIDGASGADNRFLIDGVDTTNLLNGTSGKALPPDFVQEVQVKASGYNAEYRASLGGVISAITKSGGNQYHGSAGIYFTSDGLQGDVRQTLRLSPTNQNVAEYVTTPLDDYSSPEPIFDLGGPILQRPALVLRRLQPAAGRTGRGRCVQQQRPDGDVQPEADRPHRQLQRHRPAHPEPARRASRRRTSATRAATRCRPRAATASSTSQPGALPAVDPARHLERFLLRRLRLGREQQDLRQRHDDPVQGRSARRRHVQHGAAAHVPGVATLPVPGSGCPFPRSRAAERQRLRRQPVEQRSSCAAT